MEASLFVRIWQCVCFMGRFHGVFWESESMVFQIIDL